MFEKKTAKLRFYAAAITVLSLICAGLFTVTVIKYYETDVQFFKYGEAFPQIVCWLIFALTAVMIVKGFFNKAANGFKSDYNKRTPFSVFGSVLTGLILLIVAVNECISKVKPSESQMIENWVNNSSENAAPFDLSIPIIVFTFISAVYFLLKPFVKKIRPLGIAFVVRTALYIVQGYFSKLSPLNSPVRILEQMACVSIMIYFVYEVRFIVTEDRPRLYLTFAPAAVFLTAVSSISQIIGILTGKIKDIGQTYNAILLLALFVYMLAKYLHYVFSGKFGPLPEPSDQPEEKPEEKPEDNAEETNEEIADDTAEENAENGQ